MGFIFGEVDQKELRNKIISEDVKNKIKSKL